jgi:DNA polymerase-3 subunit delta
LQRPAPTVYLLFGDDELAIGQFISRLREKLGDASSISLNTRHFEGPSLDLSELAQAVQAVPFLARRRLVVIRRAGACLTGGPNKQHLFFEALEAVPPTTALVLVETSDSKAAASLQSWADEHPDTAYVRTLSSPKGEAFVRWLIERCKAHGGQIEPPAAHLLAELLADDPLLGDQELCKLLDYVGRSRPIREEDVHQLTPYRGQSNVFAMVDALGEGDGPRALGLLHRLLEDESPRYAFSMITRQFRLLLQAREALDDGRDISTVLSLHPYVASKLTTQARQFTLPKLEAMYHLLLQTDLSIKSSLSDETVALDTLVASLSSHT